MMKLIRNLLLVCFAIMSFLSFSQKPQYERDSFKVLGNCDMCKTKIEKAAKSVDGVKTAKWNVVNGKMKVKFNAELTNSDKIQEAIAAIGYDTEKHKASDEVYNKLHYCCKYEREQ